MPNDEESLNQTIVFDSDTDAIEADFDSAMTEIKKSLMDVSTFSKALTNQDKARLDLAKKLESIENRIAKIDKKRKDTKDDSNTDESEGLQYTKEEEETLKEVNRLHEDLIAKQRTALDIKRMAAAEGDKAYQLAIKSGKSEGEARKVSKARAKEVKQGLESQTEKGGGLLAVLRTITETLGSMAIPLAAISSIAGVIALLVDAEAKAKELRGDLIDIAGMSGDLQALFSTEGILEQGAIDDLFSRLRTVAGEYHTTSSNVGAIIKAFADQGVADLSRVETQAAATFQTAALLGKEPAAAAQFLAESMLTLDKNSEQAAQTMRDLYGEMTLSGLGASRFSTILMNSAQNAIYFGGQMQEAANLLSILGDKSSTSATKTVKSFESIKSAGDSLDESLQGYIARYPHLIKATADQVEKEMASGSEIGRLWAKKFGKAALGNIKLADYLEKEGAIVFKELYAAFPGEQKLGMLLDAISGQNKMLEKGIHDPKANTLLQSILGMDAKSTNDLLVALAKVEATAKKYDANVGIGHLLYSSEKQKELLGKMGEEDRKMTEEMLKGVADTRTSSISVLTKIKNIIENWLPTLGMTVANMAGDFRSFVGGVEGIFRSSPVLRNLMGIKSSPSFRDDQYLITAMSKVSDTMTREVALSVARELYRSGKSAELQELLKVVKSGASLDIPTLRKIQKGAIDPDPSALTGSQMEDVWKGLVEQEGAFAKAAAKSIESSVSKIYDEGKTVSLDMEALRKQVGSVAPERGAGTSKQEVNMKVDVNVNGVTVDDVRLGDMVTKGIEARVVPAYREMHTKQRIADYQKYSGRRP